MKLDQGTIRVLCLLTLIFKSTNKKKHQHTSEISEETFADRHALWDIKSHC